MEPIGTLLATARDAYARGEWRPAYDGFEQARSLSPLDVEDLARLGDAAWWVGDVRESVVDSEEVFHRYENDGEKLAAAMKALDLGLLWTLRGDLMIASGWINRARRMLLDAPQSPVHGYLLYLDTVNALLFAEDPEPALAAAEELQQMGRRFNAPVLHSFSLTLIGLADLRAGRTASGFAALDEAMLPVLAGQVPPTWAGDIYCTVLHACYQLADLPRMRAWTEATERWCEQLAGGMVFSGVCHIHRLQIRSIEGNWDGVEREIAQSSLELADRNVWAAGEGYYQLGELRRLRGDLQGASDSYAKARDLGVEPQPGEAKLLAARGHVDAAWAGLAAALESNDRLTRAQMLLPAVELAVQLKLTVEAEEYCRELEQSAGDFGSPGFLAWARHARGVLLFSGGQAAQALSVLRSALQGYRSLHHRHDTARVYELLAAVHRELGQPETAASEAATALAIYRELGAEPDVRRLDGQKSPGGLTEREAEVLACIARGATNKETAAALFISQKTVGRHLANIFLKIGVSSRTAAAAWAHEHGITAPLTRR